MKSPEKDSHQVVIRGSSARHQPKKENKDDAKSRSNHDRREIIDVNIQLVGRNLKTKDSQKKLDNSTLLCQTRSKMLFSPRVRRAVLTADK